MRPLGWLALLALCAWLTLCASCDPTTPDAGSLVGTFTIVATLQSNSCAPGYSPTTPQTFSAALYASGGNSTWATGGSSATGTASGNTIHVSAQSSMTPYTNCVIVTTDTIDATYSVTPLDSGTPDAGAHSATISGTDTITLSTTSGEACLAVLVANGGTYPSLPCSAVFTFTGATH